MADPHRKGILRTESVFKNPKALSPDWIPEIGQKMLGQDAVITNFIYIHRPIIENKGEFSINTFIIGQNCGKTLTVRYFLSRISPFALQSGLTIRTWYCNCLSLRTKNSK